MVLTPHPTRDGLWAIPVSDLAGVARHVLDVARTGIPGWRVVFLTPPGELPRELRAVGAEVVEGCLRSRARPACVGGDAARRRTP